MTLGSVPPEGLTLIDSQKEPPVMSLRQGSVLHTFLLGCPLFFLLTGCAVEKASVADQEGDPPLAARIPVVETHHGQERVDEYHWLSDREDPRVARYLELENEHTTSFLKKLQPLRANLREEARHRMGLASWSWSFRQGGFEYSFEKDIGKYGTYYRKPIDSDAPKELVLDLAEVAGDSAFFELGAFEMSPDHRVVLYTVDRTGATNYEIGLRSMDGTKSWAKLPAMAAWNGITWSPDGRSILYSRPGSARRVYRHVLGTDPEGDEVVYEEIDSRFSCAVSRSRSGRFALLETGSVDIREWWYFDGQHPEAGFRVLMPRKEGVFYGVVHSGDHFFVRTNEASPNYEIWSIPIDQVATQRWKTVIPGSDSTTIETISGFQNYLLIQERENGRTRLKVFNPTTGQAQIIQGPPSALLTRPGVNKQYESERVSVICDSPVMPWTWYEYDVHRGDLVCVSTGPAAESSFPNRYHCTVEYVRTRDGVDVPLTLVHAKSMRRDGNNPVLLGGYGAFGETVGLFFSPYALTLVDRGVIVAFAHVRGGGFLGPRWHAEGRRLKKRNTFSDFIACAEYLVEKGYTRPARLGIQGGSAGGLLVATVANMRPDLFGAVLANVPAVDLLGAVLIPDDPISSAVREEFGDPGDPESYRCMLSYSPYDNVRAQDYPPMFVTAGFNDASVAYWQVAKWVARLRYLKTDDQPLLLRTKMEAGHITTTTDEESISDLADQLAFLLHCLGVEPKEAELSRGQG